MTRPTHVMVASPMQCDVCKGTGKHPPGYLCGKTLINRRGEQLCPECGGATLQQHWITLEEFAKLFTYGETYDSHEIRVREPVPQGGDGDG